MPARTACAARGCSPTWRPTSRRSPPGRWARARPNCCASPTRTSPRRPRRRWRRRSWPRSGRCPRAASSPTSWRRSAGPAAGTTGASRPVCATLADAPWALIGRGDPALLERLEPEGTVTVVGARRASAYGREVARELGRELAAAGLLVVSGLAFGIDACAHRGALEAGHHRRRARLRRRRRLPGLAPLALAADRRERPGPLGAAAGDRRLALVPSRRATGSWPRWPG